MTVTNTKNDLASSLTGHYDISRPLFTAANYEIILSEYGFERMSAIQILNDFCPVYAEDQTLRNEDNPCVSSNDDVLVSRESLPKILLLLVSLVDHRFLLRYIEHTVDDLLIALVNTISQGL